MDGWGIGIFVVSIILYFITKKKSFFLFTAGVGAGILIGALWSVMIIKNAFSAFQ